MSSPWAKVPQVQPVDLAEIMSEEVARDLQAKEDALHLSLLQRQQPTESLQESHIDAATPPQEDYELACKLHDEDNEQLRNDSEIAMMLQQQFDKEYDDMLKLAENKVNGNHKVTISLNNYRRAPLNPDFESDSEKEEEPENPNMDWDRFDGVNRDYRAMPPCGYKMKDGNMVTKHDTALNGRRNACRMMSFPLECETGDGAGFDMQLSNKVFNSLKTHSKNELMRRYRIHDRKADHATAEFGMDEATRLLIYKMLNNQLLESVNGVISIGKEAVVLHADCNQAYEAQPLPAECVLKVFKTTLAEYKQRDKYIRDDHRFKDRMGKLTKRKVVHLWAEKEMRNLARLRRAGVPAPSVIQLKAHVLVMSFVGRDHLPAPKLKEACLSDAGWIVAYAQLQDVMQQMYRDANLIHADLSEYNVLWHDEQCYVIDVSQAVEPAHENAFHFLFRDCTNVYNFFTKKGVPGVETPEAMFKSITGCEFADRVGLLELQEHIKMKPHLVDQPGVELNYRFDNAWERSTLARQATPEPPPLAAADLVEAPTA